MRKIRKLIFGLFLSALSFFYSLPSQAQAIQIIHFGILHFYPPFVYNKDVGFDIALAKALCKEMQATCTFQSMSLDQALASLKAKKLDAVISSLSITPLRAVSFDFTKPYLIGKAIYIGDGHKNFAADPLKNKSIGVVSTSTFEGYLATLIGSLGIKIIPFDQATDVIAHLGDDNKTIDLGLMDAPLARYWVTQSDGGLQLVGEPFVLPFDQGYGIAVQKPNPQLVNSLNEALRKLVLNGTYARLVHMYLGGEYRYFIATPNWISQLTPPL